MSNVTATFQTADQNWNDATTIYWFALDGTDLGTDQSFNGELFGIAESDGGSTVVDSDGAPVDYSEHTRQLVERVAVVTDTLRAQVSGL